MSPEKHSLLTFKWWRLEGFQAGFAPLLGVSGELRTFVCVSPPLPTLRSFQGIITVLSKGEFVGQPGTCWTELPREGCLGCVYNFI